MHGAIMRTILALAFSAFAGVLFVGCAAPPSNEDASSTAAAQTDRASPDLPANRDVCTRIVSAGAKATFTVHVPKGSIGHLEAARSLASGDAFQVSVDGLQPRAAIERDRTAISVELLLGDNSTETTYELTVDNTKGSQASSPTASSAPRTRCSAGSAVSPVPSAG
jgi:hypothetical protein